MNIFFLVTAWNTEESIKGNVNHNVSDFEVNGFISWKQRYVKNSFLTEAIFTGVTDWKLLQKILFLPRIQTADYLLQKILCCKIIYIKEVTKTIQNVIFRQRRFLKTQNFFRLPPTAIAFKDVIVIKWREQQLSFHPHFIYKGFTSLCIFLCFQFIVCSMYYVQYFCDVVRNQT